MTNKQTVLRALACFADPSRRDEYFDLYSANVVLHGYDGVEPGLEGVKRYYAAFWAAFPDARVEAQDILEEGEKLALRFVIRGTHQGPLPGIAATGKEVTIPGMTILRFQDGRCVERWSITNSLSLLIQLGAFPPA